MARLAGLTGSGWLRLDDSARRPYWGQSPLDAVADWGPVVAAGGSAAAVVAASMCRDGRVREAAVAVLARMPDPVAGGALAVRVTDWVPQVSSAAVHAVSARYGPDQAAVIVPVSLAVRRRLRGRQAAEAYLAGLARGPAATLWSLAEAGGRDCRLWALEALAVRGLLEAEALMARAMRDRDPVIALWCARHLTAPSGELPLAAGSRLVKSVRAGVRGFAIGHLRDDHLSRDTVRELLLDRSGAVRAVARWRWRRQWGDLPPVYRAVLAGDSRPRQIAAALHGLDEDRDSSMPAAAIPFLTHPSPVVRRAAVQAVGRHGSSGDILEHLIPMLQDSSGKVMATALRYLHGHALPSSVLASLDAACTPRSRRIALSIRQHLDTWDRVHADLAAINGQDPALAEAARVDLLAWLQHGAATSYGQPDASQAAKIAELLSTHKLTDKQRREIAFVAGIRMPDTDQRPDSPSYVDKVAPAGQ